MLTFNLKKEWFNKIKSGKKTHEYRRQTNYWFIRIWGLGVVFPCELKDFKNSLETGTISAIKYFVRDKICFACGYPKTEDKEKRLYAKIVSVTCNVNGLKTDLKINEPVLDIEFELIKRGRH